jgi:hypothetical protein
MVEPRLCARLLRRGLALGAARQGRWAASPASAVVAAVADAAAALSRRRCRRALSTAALCGADDPDSLAVPLAGPNVCIWGANTGVGKTIVSAGLAHAAAEAGVSEEKMCFLNYLRFIFWAFF